jgi:hypothetical protein
MADSGAAVANFIHSRSGLSDLHFRSSAWAILFGWRNLAVGALGRSRRPLGWDAMALFGCAPKRPLDYLGSAVLLWAINGGRLLELHRDWAVIDVPVHGSQRTFYRRNVDPAKMTLPWTKQTSSSQPAALGRQGSRKAGRLPRP